MKNRLFRMRQAFFDDLLRGFAKVPDSGPGKALLPFDLHVLLRKARKGVEQMDRPVRERCIDARGKVAAEDAKLRRRARDVFLMDLFGQQPHHGSPGVKGLQRIRTQDRSFKAELPDLRLHLSGPLLIHDAEAHAVRCGLQALLR